MAMSRLGDKFDSWSSPKWLKSQVDEIETFISQIAYKGFDPVALREELSSKKDRDLILAIALYMERGSNINKMTQGTKMSAEGKNAVNRLMTALNISARGSTPGAVTLPRIALALPELAVIYSAQHRRSMPVAWSGPRAMMTQAFASCIPRQMESGYTEEDLGYILNAHMLAMYHLSMAINPKFVEKGIEERVMEVERYVAIGLTSVVLTGEQRAKVLDAVDIRSEMGKVRELAGEWMKLKRGG